MQRRIHPLEGNFNIRAGLGAVNSVHDEQLGILHPSHLPAQVSQGHTAVRRGKSKNCLINNISSLNSCFALTLKMLINLNLYF